MLVFRQTFKILLIPVLSALFLTVTGQEIQQKQPQITAEKMRLLILPSRSDSTDSFSIENEVTAVVSGVATELRRFEVIDRNNLQNILEEQALHLSGLITDSMVVDIGQIAAAGDALIVKVLNFSQKGVPPQETDEEEEDDDLGFFEQLVSSVVVGIFSGSSEKEDEPYADNIQTQLSVQIRKIDVETGQSLHSFDIDAGHTGGTRGKSRAEVLQQFRNSVIDELKKLYLLTSEVVSVDGNEILLYLGSEVGVSEGSVFEIKEPDRKKKFAGRELMIPGRRAGFVCVQDISGESNRSFVLREWREIKPGYKALEFPKYIFGLQLSFFPPLMDAPLKLGIEFNGRPLRTFDFGGGISFVQVKDSNKEYDSGFCIGGFGKMRIFNSSFIKLGANIGIELDILFKDDDENHTVTAAVFSLLPGLYLDILLSAKSDLTLTGGYRLGGKTSTWEYSQGEETHSAIWYNGKPAIDISGYYFSVGYKYLIF